MQPKSVKICYLIGLYYAKMSSDDHFVREGEGGWKLFFCCCFSFSFWPIQNPQETNIKVHYACFCCCCFCVFWFWTSPGSWVRVSKLMKWEQSCSISSSGIKVNFQSFGRKYMKLPVHLLIIKSPPRCIVGKTVRIKYMKGFSVIWIFI